MRTLVREAVRSMVSLVVLGTVCCVVYPGVVLGIARLAFPWQADGSVVRDASGRVVGSRWIGQEFRSDHYFHPRPSAAGAGYDAMNSGGGNLGPTSLKLRDQIAERVAAYRHENGLSADTLIPADAVTASGSGLDPHISLENARLQAPRVARARQLELPRVMALIQTQAESDPLRPGMPILHVLDLNLALDRR